MVTEADWDNQNHQTFKPYLDKSFEIFPTERLMIGSDWLVCTVVRNYQSAMNIVMEYIHHMSTTDQELILGKACKEFYNL